MTLAPTLFQSAPVPPPATAAGSAGPPKPPPAYPAPAFVLPPLPRGAITFFVPGEPVGQPRIRARVMKGAKPFAHMYTPPTADEWKRAIKAAARPHLPAVPFAGPISVESIFYFPRPGRLNRKCDPAGPLYHLARPDRDNCEKSLLDALSDVGFWENDWLVCEGPPRKRYVAKVGPESTPGVRVIVIPLEALS